MEGLLAVVTAAGGAALHFRADSMLPFRVLYQRSMDNCIASALGLLSKSISGADPKK